MPESDSQAPALARQAAELEILQRVASEVNSTLELEEIYAIALRTMDQLFSFHHAVILLVEPDGQTLRVVASRGYENQAIGGRVQFGTGVVGVVAQKRRMMQLGNLGQQRAYAAAQRREMEKAGRGAEIGDAIPVPGLPNVESQIAIPLLIRDELIGVFSIESPVRHTFDEHDRGLVTIVANQIASAIRNAQLYEDRRQAAQALQAANATLEARVAERTAALERELRVAEDLLRHARSRVDGPLIGESQAVRTLRDLVAREASQTEPLLLVGPPGAGKEAVAHALHAASGRTGALIIVSCPELHTQSRHTPSTGTSIRSPEQLLATKIELAAGGTLFLESIHELPSELHAELRGALDRQQRARRSGELAAPDIRFIAAMPVEPPRGVPSRLDALFAGLVIRRIAVPPLAERREDIPAIADYFVRRLARQLGKVVESISPASLQRLERYSWPGNVRELQSVLERSMLVARSPVLEVDEELLDDTRTIGSYRLVSRIGAGGMGEVWLARHRLLARPAAVKLIRHDVQSGTAREQLVKRFQREAQVTAGLRSPHTVQLYDFGVTDDGGFYYVMELLEGFDLQHIVNRFGPQPAERVAMLMAQACRSLAEAHGRGLVHRDIKPANLFVARLGTEYDYLKALDFGIVKDQPDQDATILSGQQLQGTPAFMAPEVAFGESPIDGRADLYSLACSAYWALTGRMVFQANTPAQMLLHHVQTKPMPPSSVTELPIPKALDTILMACLEKSPGNRPPSALECESLFAGIRFDEPWNQDRARAWWLVHAPDVVRSGD